jgi:hypothetical protein
MGYELIIDVVVTPSRTWVEEAMRANGEDPTEEEGEEEKKPSLLSLRVCNPARALESVYHVLDVLEGSPAEVRLSSLHILVFGVANNLDGRYVHIYRLCHYGQRRS